MTSDLFCVGLSQGLVLALIAYAVMIPFRLLNFPDLSAEGSYPFAGAICATSLAFGAMPIFAIILGVLGAGFLGIATALVHLRLRVNSILAGIIVSTMAYSLNLRIMGKPNIALFNVNGLFGNADILGNILTLLGILICCIIPLMLFLRSDFGLRLRAIGLNPGFASKQAISVEKYTIFGLFLGGSMSGLAGSLMVQIQSYMDISMGVGIVIHGLAALMIGEALIGNSTMARQLAAPLVGAMIYQQIQGVALSFGLAPSDLKFFTASIVLIVIAIKRKNIRLLV